MNTTPQVLLGRYEVGRLLGAGGMAEVFEGRDRLLARRVAIKVPLSQYAHDPEFAQRFRREAQAAASLSHPGVVAVYDTGSEHGTHFIVMEYVDGRTLKDVIRAEAPLYPDRAAEICADVCSALAAAHARGLVHRDVKPANIMLMPDGRVKLMDLGIARAAVGETLTQTAAMLGTAQYLSPEQAQGQEVDFRGDLYSLGCCLYEMLTGTVPFRGATPVAIAYRHVREDPAPPRLLNPDIPASLEAVCLKAMAKRPENRYQTAAELRADLERVRAGQRDLGHGRRDGDRRPGGPPQRAAAGPAALVAVGAGAARGRGPGRRGRVHGLAAGRPAAHDRVGPDPAHRHQGAGGPDDRPPDLDLPAPQHLAAAHHHRAADHPAAHHPGAAGPGAGPRRDRSPGPGRPGPAGSRRPPGEPAAVTRRRPPAGRPGRPPEPARRHHRRPRLHRHHRHRLPLRRRRRQRERLTRSCRRRVPRAGGSCCSGPPGTPAG